MGHMLQSYQHIPILRRATSLIMWPREVVSKSGRRTEHMLWFSTCSPHTTACKLDVWSLTKTWLKTPNKHDLTFPCPTQRLCIGDRDGIDSCLPSTAAVDVRQVQHSYYLWPFHMPHTLHTHELAMPSLMYHMNMLEYAAYRTPQASHDGTACLPAVPQALHYVHVFFKMTICIPVFQEAATEAPWSSMPHACSACTYQYMA